MKKGTQKPAWANNPSVATPKKKAVKKATRKPQGGPVGINPPGRKKPNWAEDASGKKLFYDVETTTNGQPVVYVMDEDHKAPISGVMEKDEYAEAQVASEKRLKDFLDKYKKPADSAQRAIWDVLTRKPTTITSGYMHVLPDSHFWNKLETLINFLKYLPESKTSAHLIKGIENTIANGYELVKLGADAPGPGTFWKRMQSLTTGSIPVTKEEFVDIMSKNRPSEIWLAVGPHKEVVYSLSNYQIEHSDKRVSPSVIVAEVETRHGKKSMKQGTRFVRYTLKALYNKMNEIAPLTAYTFH